MNDLFASITRWLVPGCFCLCATLHAEVRLLTGDAGDAIHNSSSTLMDISADGDRILFRTGPPATGSTPGITSGGLYIRRISANSLAFVGAPSVADPGVVEASLSDDGRFIAWSTTNEHVYWRDTRDGITRKITQNANGACREPVVSADGRYVAFVSAARNLIADTTKLPALGRSAVYVYDSLNLITTVASLTPAGAALNTGIGSQGSALNSFDFSADGRFVVYSTEADNAHPGRVEMNAGWLCVCRRNLATGEVLMLNRNAAGTVANGNFTAPRISADGNRAAFFGGSIGLFDSAKMIASVPENFSSDLYIKDVTTQAVWWGSKTTDGSAHEALFGERLAIDADGDVVSFPSNSAKLVAENTDSGGGTAGTMDIFRADLGAGGAVSTSFVSRSPGGGTNVDYRHGPVLPGTGAYVAFATDQLQAMLGVANPYTGNFQAVGVGTFPSVATTFEQWAAALSEGSRGANATPWEDGVDNLAKYFMGMDSGRADRSRLPRVATRTAAELGLPAGSGTFLTLEVRIRRDLPAGYTWVVRAAAHPGELVSGSAAIQVGAPVADGNADVYLFRFPSAIQGDKGFMNARFFKP